MCCPGCIAVAELIESQGLDRFYDYRSAPAMKPGDDAVRPGRWAVYDRPELVERLCHRVSDDVSELQCNVAGVNCAACSWLIDRSLRSLEGVREVSVNPVTGETVIRFDPQRQQPSEILTRMAELGFDPQPRLPGGRFGSAASATRAELKRLAVAGLGFAQIMSLSAALYLGAFKSMEASFRSFFIYASMLVATPVVLYAGAPMFKSAWASLARRQLGMDVPVSLAMLAALGVSLLNAFRGTGDVYFDSATMFVFFLTVGRFLESRARHRAGSLFSTLDELLPQSARRKVGDSIEEVGTIELSIGDRVIVAPGEAVPADGELLTEEALFDESLLCGESLGRRRSAGEKVVGGSLNTGTRPVEILVRQIGSDTYVARVGSLLQTAMADRPAFLEMADRWASWFVGAVLAVTLVVGVYWSAVATSELTFQVVLSMLIVTCPCALSLAAPTAYAVALGRLARRGLLLRSARALERLCAVGTWLFDKTGTLTEGRLKVTHVELYGKLSRDECLAVAAALEAGVEHPLARALSGQSGSARAAEVEVSPGFGVQGAVEGHHYRLGSARYVGVTGSGPTAGPVVYLARDGEVLARIELADELRRHAAEAVSALRACRGEVLLVSGDSTGSVSSAARRLGIETYWSEQAPEDKLDLLATRQSRGEVVAAVGDGVNDAPLLARADVSVAMVSGSQLARASADIVFTSDDLRELASLPQRALATRRIIRQNLGWAVVYNLIAVPFAAAGILAPWMAAIGMSLSSLIVVGNALRLAGRIDAPAAHVTAAHERVLLSNPEATA